VLVTDRLSTNLDWAAFELTEIGFGDHLVTVPDRTAHFETIVPIVSNGRQLEVHIEVRLDRTSGRLTAQFMTLDPLTELPPDVQSGFLPPEDGTGRGQGHVSYVIRPKPDRATGTEIRNVAVIQFDFGQTIGTNQRDPHDPSQGTDSALEALVTIDAGPPSSHVWPLPPAIAALNFTVSWTGQDDSGGAGVADYEIFVSDNGGPWTCWQEAVTGVSATFSGQLGHTYAFYSIARDQLDHVEAPPASADAVTTLVAQLPPTLTVQWLAPAIQLAWPLDATGYALETTDSLAADCVWNSVTEPVVVQGQKNTVTLLPTERARFYRLNR
jgi:hypothetical protein